MKRRGLRVSPELFALGWCADKLSNLVWWRTKDGQRGVNPPKSVLAYLNGENPKREERVFASGADFRAEWNRLAGKER